MDATYYSVLFREGVKKVFTHHVKLDDDGRHYSITDDAYDVEWAAGASLEHLSRPTLHLNAERQMGTVKEFSFEKVIAFDDHGHYGKVVDYRFDSETGRKLIRGAAAGLGLKQRMGLTTKIGLACGIVGGAGAVAAVVALLFK